MLKQNPFEVIESIENIKNIILVASGKGGVGKSTVSTNLSVALAREGHAVGLLDADLYGPSIPLSLGLDGQYPEVRKVGDKDIMFPLINFGVKVMSLGFLMSKQDAVIWRGPMVSKALTQLIEDTDWGDLDYLVVDLPPGTGDISITLAQKLPKSKAIIVITPQKMATADGRRAANMFQKEGIDIEVLGVVENMSWFTPEKHPDEKYYLFGIGGGESLAKETNTELLAQIPLVSDVCNLGDTGQTVFASTSNIIVEAFEKLAQNIHEKHALNALK
ncbi:MAG: Mrp/NBP35 family ATP-binding protein [Bacteroidales bacterium]|nr:Mrp/NBP35 family ATP-binding protein [Bacteroidales bacterium]MBN2819938.1 Mrp/NBP35 family ATP-binding protein [Bacteroidales bacterium]